MRFTFRRRILALVLGVGVVPLAILGLWLTGTGARASEHLLRGRLEQALDRAAADVGSRWLERRAQLLELAESDSVITLVAVRDAASAHAGDGVLAGMESAPPGARGVLARVPVWSDRSPQATRVGWVTTTLDAGELLPPASRTFGLGISVGALDDAGATLVPLPLPVHDSAGGRVEWAGETWLIARRRLREPPLALVAAAPLDPLIVPFRGTARRGLLWVAWVAAAGLAAAVLLTRAMTRSLGTLVDATDAVRRGDLTRRIAPHGSDEVAQLGHAFDAMTATLESTLGQLSQRESLAAVGRFASELAHEVRNPLTAIRVDLQYVEERLPEGSELRHVQEGALAEVDRLQRTVSGALHLARSGTVERRHLDLRDVIDAAARAARTQFTAREAMLTNEPMPEPIPVRGDFDALQRLFLNLLGNAAQAVDPGGSVVVAAFPEGDDVFVTIDDDGPGIAADLMTRVREPFFTTRADGTGLGLAVADRIVHAHDGRLELTSLPGGGTRATVRLPRLPA